VLLDHAQRYLSLRKKGMPSDQELEGAWTAFYKLYSEKIRKYAFTCGATDKDIPDCMQDVWTELLLRLRK
jgi:hypothetical protein